MAEVYFKAGSICEADYAIHQQISNELHSQSYIPRLKHKNLSSTSSSMNKNADTTVSKLDLALAFYYRANNGDLLYVLKADSAYERLHKQMCNSNDYDPIIAREKPNLLLSDM